MNPLTKAFGQALQFGLQTFVKVTGTTLKKADVPWLNGPVGEDVIGEEFFKRYCQREGFTYNYNDKDEGLIPDFNILASGDFKPAEVHPEIIRFYEHTADYKFDIWSQWHGLVQYGSKILIGSVSAQIKQLNMPLDPMAARYGMSSEIITITNKEGKVPFHCWLRKLMPQNEVIYSGFYTPFYLPKQNGHVVKTIFPLPKGYVCVLLRPQNVPGGGFKLISDGSKIGEPGYYRILDKDEQHIKVKIVPMSESLELYVTEDGELRCDHWFHLMGMKLLHLHYKITRK